MEELPEGRICSLCKEYKTKEYFGIHKGKIRSQCKSCEKEYRENNKERIHEHAKVYRDSNKEKIAARHRGYREKDPNFRKEYDRAYAETHREETNARCKAHYENNKEHYKEIHKAYRDNNPEKVKAQCDAYLESHKEERTAYVRQWCKDNPDKVAAKDHRRRARKLGAEGDFSGNDILNLLESQHGRCCFCGTDITEKYEVEHIVPLSKNGSNWPSNLQLACRSCNASKHDKNNEEYLEYLQRFYPDKYEIYLKHQDYIETLRLLSDWRL